MLQPHYRYLLRALSHNIPQPEADLPKKDDQMLYLGDNFGASISLDCARRVLYVDGRPGFSFVDIWILDGKGDTHIIRSQRTNMTAEETKNLVASATRQIGAFLLVNKDVDLKAPLPMKDKDIQAGKRRNRVAELSGINGDDD